MYFCHISGSDLGGEDVPLLIGRDSFGHAGRASPPPTMSGRLERTARVSAAGSPGAAERVAAMPRNTVAKAELPDLPSGLVCGIGDIMTEVSLAGVKSAKSPRWPSERTLAEVGVDGTASYFDFFPDDSSAAFSWTRAAESMFESE